VSRLPPCGSGVHPEAHCSAALLLLVQGTTAVPTPALDAALLAGRCYAGCSGVALIAKTSTMWDAIIGALVGGFLALAGGVLTQWWQVRRLARVAAALIAQELEAQRGVIHWVKRSGQEDHFVISVWESERANFVTGTSAKNRIPVTDWYSSIYYSHLVDPASADAKLEKCERALEAATRSATGRFS
jgi:hypothetical protein